MYCLICCSALFFAILIRFVLLRVVRCGCLLLRVVVCCCLLLVVGVSGSFVVACSC